MSSWRKPGPITAGPGFAKDVANRARSIDSAVWVPALRFAWPGRRVRMWHAPSLNTVSASASEAIQNLSMEGFWIASSLALLAMTVNKTHRRILAAAFTRVLRQHRPSWRIEGAGNAGCTLHPRSRVQVSAKESAHEHTGEAEASGIPCAMALRLISRSPRGALLCCPRREADRFRSLDASVGAPGPRDFAVRDYAIRLGTSASTASRLTFGDDWPNAPLAEAGCARTCF